MSLCSAPSKTIKRSCPITMISDIGSLYCLFKAMGNHDVEIIKIKSSLGALASLRSMSWLTYPKASPVSVMTSWPIQFESLSVIFILCQKLLSLLWGDVVYW